MKRSIKTVIGATAVAISAATIASPVASAAPATTTGPTTQAAPTGDGVWAPSHDEALALIPVCSGPTATFSWLNANFTDHGNDVKAAIKRNTALVTSILTFSASPYQVLEGLFVDVLQVPVYAVNDVVFHDPATVKDILTFCASTRK
ncbi:hypothetical protein HQP04_13040 [Rhodococcus fascians]|uniref:hypothetical protein n=1 Tax=Nocardiaceae TaxID=85025 RepID=UPI00050C4E0E|nr:MULTISPECIES: hypothetical protein [Rhodococcus]MBY4010522.1 hypothetical protein [Rhodococcus fascians]MBY4022947.1 hypothetical protein [Rhodococcus fascians]OZD06324.1 hypothetical protein CH281_09785 [Rhodococcus sp. 06-221-2]